jgi:hypothetical protein
VQQLPKALPTHVYGVFDPQLPSGLIVIDVGLGVGEGVALFVVNFELVGI